MLAESTLFTKKFMRKDSSCYDPKSDRYTSTPMTFFRDVSRRPSPGQYSTVSGARRPNRPNLVLLNVPLSIRIWASDVRLVLERIGAGLEQ